MKTSLIGVTLLSLAIGARSLAAPPLPAEHLTVEKLPPNNAHRIYVLDDAFVNEIDGRVHLFDGDTYRRLGQIDAGFNPGFNLSPDGKTTVVATTYFSRGSRGTRTDIVEFNDNTTLSVTHEIILLPKRAMTVPTYFNIAYSADSRFLYVSYVTPAASFGVLDPSKYSVIGEIDTAGCVLVIPSGPNRVSSLSARAAGCSP
jgi:methylamine dehydrogenase heavy chain